MPTLRIELAYGVSEDTVLDVLRDNGMCTCEHCDGLHFEDDSRSIRTGSGRHDHEIWCEDCADSDAITCDGCGEQCAPDCIHTDDSGTSICDRCSEDSYSMCGNCNTWINTYNSDYYSNDDGIYCCRECSGDENEVEATEETDELRALQDSTQRAPQGAIINGRCGYHSDTVRSRWTIPDGAYSVEIECCAPDVTGRDDCASHLRNVYLSACERDGSLDDTLGMEVITAPAILENQKTALVGILDKLREYKFTAWNKGKGYGIHINVDAREWNLDKITAYCNLFHASLKSTWEAVAGREENHWARYKQNEDSLVPTDKYSACALKTGGRLEVRIFRSTLKESTALGYLALCADLVRYVDCDLSARPLGLFAWLKHNASAETRALLVDKLGTEYQAPAIAAE